MNAEVIIESVAANLFEVYQTSLGHYPGAFSGKPNTAPTWSQLAADTSPEAVRQAAAWRAVSKHVMKLAPNVDKPWLTVLPDDVN